MAKRKPPESIRREIYYLVRVKNDAGEFEQVGPYWSSQAVAQNFVRSMDPEGIVDTIVERVTVSTDTETVWASWE